MYIFGLTITRTSRIELFEKEREHRQQTIATLQTTNERLRESYAVKVTALSETHEQLARSMRERDDAKESKKDLRALTDGQHKRITELTVERVVEAETGIEAATLMKNLYIEMLAEKTALIAEKTARIDELEGINAANLTAVEGMATEMVGWGTERDNARLVMDGQVEVIAELKGRHRRTRSRHRQECAPQGPGTLRGRRSRP